MRTKARTRKTVSTVQKLSMGMGDLGYSMVSNTMSSFIMFFGNTVLGVPGTLMGLAVAGGTMWDAVTDPIVGHLSDNFRGKRFGRRHPFILMGIIFMAVVNILLWSVPRDWTPIYKFIWFGIGIVLLETCHTFFATPNSALSIEITPDYHERSSVQAFKSVFAIIGLLLPTLLMGVFQKPTIEYPDGRFNPQSYLNFAYISSASVIVLGTIMFITTFSHIPRLKALADKEKREEKGKNLRQIFQSFFATLKNKNFRSVIIGYSAAMMSATIIVAFGFNVFTFTFKTSTVQMYIVMAGLFAMTIAGQPLWLYLSRKFNKKTAMLAGLYTSLVGCILIFVIFFMRHTLNAMLYQNSFSLIFFMLPLMVAGLGTGVLFSMPLVLLGDAITVEKANALSAVDKTATYTGFMTLAYKASQSISQLILGTLLDLVGFKGGSSSQTPYVESALGWMLSIGVTVSILLGIIIFSRYNIKREEVEDALAKIENS